MKYDNSIWKSMAMVSQFGISMIVPIFMMSAVGYYIDKYFNTKIWFILLFFVGALAGAKSVYNLAKNVFKKGDSSNE